MELTYIRELYDYNHWANQRALAAAAKLSPEAFTKPMGNSFSSVRDTLAHILSAEWIWLERWNGRFPRAMLDAAAFPSLVALASRWKTVEDERREFISRVTHDRLRHELEYINRQGEKFSYPLWQQMVHVINHSTYHRGQITTMLRQLGAQAVETDLLLYYDEQAGS